MVRAAAAGAPTRIMANIALNVKIRQKCRGSRPVLGVLGFQLADGEIVALVGPSGCGKTTLLKIIGGLDTDFDGLISWRGDQRPRIGTVFQEPRLLPWRTVRQNLALVLPPDARAGADDLLHRLNLWIFRDAYPAQLSLGMARRVAIARAFAIEPEIVLLDEPFVSLDPEMAARCRDLLLDAWRRRPTAALLVTHDMTEAASLADRILLLSAGPMRILTDVTVPTSIRRNGVAAAAGFAQQLAAMAGSPGATSALPDRQ